MLASEYVYFVCRAPCSVGVYHRKFGYDRFAELYRYNGKHYACQYQQQYQRYHKVAKQIAFYRAFSLTVAVQVPPVCNKRVGGGVCVAYALASGKENMVDVVQLVLTQKTQQSAVVVNDHLCPDKRLYRLTYGIFCKFCVGVHMCDS